jgi:6-phosphofructokinase 1
MSEHSPVKRIAMLVGGGPAPGINGVISAATIEALNRGVEVIGCQDGYRWLVKRDKSHTRKLLRPEVIPVAFKGGSVLGTARTNPTKDPQHMANVMAVFRELEIDGLVSIGGDDTAFSASQIYAFAKSEGQPIRVAHVPKTIDNDIPLEGSTPTFGYETARHIGVQILRALSEDAKTTSRWYVIVSMGRAAGHLALGIGKAAGAQLTVIPEEYGDRQDVPLDEICDVITGSIVKRRSIGKAYGVVVLAEGLIEKIGEKELTRAMGSNLGRYGTMLRDEFGHLRLGEIEFSRMVRDYLTGRLEQIGIELTMIDKDLGYELRCADPIPFDAEYTRDLGYGAVKFLRSRASAEHGAVISFVAGKMKPIPFADIINPATKRMNPRMVDVTSESYASARSYMFRLEPADVEEVSQLAKIAAQTNLAPDQFRNRFGYLAGVK